MTAALQFSSMLPVPAVPLRAPIDAPLNAEEVAAAIEVAETHLALCLQQLPAFSDRKPRHENRMREAYGAVCDAYAAHKALEGGR